jgi:hypothetical protein
MVILSGFVVTGGLITLCYSGSRQVRGFGAL